MSYYFRIYTEFSGLKAPLKNRGKPIFHNLEKQGPTHAISSISEGKNFGKTYLNKNNMKVMPTAEEMDVFVLFLVVPAWSEILLLLFCLVLPLIWINKILKFPLTMNEDSFDDKNPDNTLSFKIHDCS